MSTRTIKILLVGDIDDSCAAAKKLLSQMPGLSTDVTRLPSGSAALDLIGRDNFEGCLLLAYLKPEEEKRILAETGKLKSPTPAVVLTDRENKSTDSELTEVICEDELTAKSLERAFRSVLTRAEAVRKMNALSEELEVKVSQLNSARTELRTKTRKLEQAHDQAREAAKWKSEFVSSIGNDLRSLISNIIGMSELLQSTPLSEEQRTYSNTLQDSSQSILTIVNDILEISKLEANKLDIQVLEFPPLTLVERSAQLMVSSARSAQLQLFTFIDPDLPPLLRGDPLRLRQILLNLLSNAIKFTKTGEVVVKALKESEDAARVRVRFEVKDSGPGLSDERQKEIFSPPAERARASGRYGRTELGLSICKRLVQLMDGQIGVESTPGQGSTFWFSVGLERSTNVSPGSKGLLSTIASDLKGISVLLVDPSKTSQEILKTYLQAAGIEATATRSATESMAVLLKQAKSGSAFDVAIVNPKGSQGQEVGLAKTAGSNQLLASTAFIFVTDEADKHTPEKLSEAGFAACLSRPVKQLQLIEQVAALAGRQSNSASSGATAGATARTITLDKTLDEPVSVPETRHSLRVLLAEDNHVLRELAALQLKRLGISAVTVENGKEALARLTDSEFDLVFLDCQMPEIDGYELTRMIREREAGSGSHMPIIAMTASVLPGDREHCLAAGMDDYLSKPINRQQLELLIKRWAEPAASIEPAAKVESGGQESDPIDLAKAKMFYGEKALPGLIKAFFNEAAQLVDNVRDAANEKDLTLTMKGVHQLKGLALSFEVHRMVALVSEIERAVQRRQWGDIERTLVNISKVLQAVAQSLERFLSNSQI